jgi:hypothetical protein
MVTGFPVPLAFGWDGGCIAQLVEQLTLNQRVAGSSPATPTNKINSLGQLSTFGKISLCTRCAHCSGYFSAEALATA